MYQVHFHELIWKEDMPSITSGDQKRIFKAIMKKLSVAPLNYGKALSYGLKNLFSLKVGEYRVIYRVSQKRVEVFVIKIGFRRNMESYIDAAARLL